jgi:hypothetical protein
VCITALGTSDALHAMQSDSQIASRFEPFHLPRWKLGKEFASFLATYAKTIPLRKASDLASDKSIGLLLARAHGITGAMAMILQRAAEHAIHAGLERIDAALIDKVSHDLSLTQEKLRS